MALKLKTIKRAVQWYVDNGTLPETAVEHAEHLHAHSISADKQRLTDIMQTLFALETLKIKQELVK